MSERDPLLLVQDMREAVARILSYTDGMSETELLADTRTQDAVLRNLQVLGEAARQVPGAARIQAPEVEWTRIVRSRHIIVHDYFGVDWGVVWRIVEVHLPALAKQLDVLERRLRDDFGRT